ncbi:hypothetical protein ACFYOT_23505 [Saccharothrix saharensis]|uniref:LIC_13387 family protein n=1 Tax=Saccharothrix saharensis TaxID=571190 RepID=UPI0036BBB9A0
MVAVMAHGALRGFRVGAWAWVVTGVGHLAIAAVLTAGPEDAAASRALTAMRERSIEIAGLRRSLYDVNQGMSLVMAAALIFGGSVCLLVARSAPDLVTRARAVSGLGVVASAVVLGLSLWLLPLPPVVLFSVALLAFGTAVVKARPRVPAQPA